MLLRLILIVGLVVGFIYVGAGARVMEGLRQLSPECVRSVGSLSPSITMPMCNGIGDAVSFLDRISTDIGNAVKGLSAEQRWGK